MAVNLGQFNVLEECRNARLSLWACPPFLFIVMGGLNIVAMIATWVIASRYTTEPEIAALLVLVVSVIIFVLGNFLIHGFHQIAEANRIKSEFIAIVSHQLRSPLSIFKWTVDLLGREDKKRTEDTPKYLAILSESTAKMIQIVNMLLEVSRIEAGKFTVKSEAVDLLQLTQDLLRSFESYAAVNRITINCRTTGEKLLPVSGDREKLIMVTQNLVDNAIRYSQAGGSVVVRILSGLSGQVEWQVEDQGIGIPKEEQKFIFQKFFRTDIARRHQTEGTGIGLYIAKAIIDALGGEIGFRSEMGKGSTFWFRLPTYKS